jgi:hypothetical protein
MGACYDRRSCIYDHLLAVRKMEQHTLSPSPGRVGHPSEYFSVGVSLYEIVTSKPPTKLFLVNFIELPSVIVLLRYTYSYPAEIRLRAFQLDNLL